MIEYKFTEYSIDEYIDYLKLCITTTGQMVVDLQLDLNHYSRPYGRFGNYEKKLKDLYTTRTFQSNWSTIWDGTPFEIRKKAIDYEYNDGYFSARKKGPFGENLVKYVDAAFERELTIIKKKYDNLTSDIESTVSIGHIEFVSQTKELIESAQLTTQMIEHLKEYLTRSQTQIIEMSRIYNSYKNYTNSQIKETLRIAIEQINDLSIYINEIEFNRFDLYPTLVLTKLPENLVKSAIKHRIESRDIKHNESDSLLYPEVIQYYTLLETDKILIERGMKDYSMYHVSRSNHKGIDTGSYFYSFDVDDNLLMTKFPFQQVELEEGTYIVFDAELYRSGEVIVIPKEEIVSFKLYGTELMQSTVTTNSKSMIMDANNNMDSATYKRPSIVGTFFSSILFGSAYTILNGVGKQMYQQTNVLGNKLDGLSDQITQVVEAINNISITTDHQIIDTSRVQIILTNKRDLEIDGISIYYDLNRVFPNLDNPSNQSVPKLEEKATHSTNMADEVLKLKALLDQGIIDEEEFKAMKKKLIN